MKAVSVVICTVEHSGREERLRLVIDRLRQQNDVEIQLILVWQGVDTAQQPRFSGVELISLDIWSSSEARNSGAAAASHPFICFLDDDTFPVDGSFLSNAIDLLTDDEIDFVTCNIKSEGDIQAGSSVNADIVLTKDTLIGNMWEPGLLVRRSAFAATRFDATLGIGCVHGSSEGLDFGVRLLANGYRGRRVAKFLIDHPPLPPVQDVQLERSFFYALGNGAVLIQHRYYRVYVWQIGKTFVRIVVSLIRRDQMRAKAALIRFFCLMLGPLVPRSLPRIMPGRLAAKRLHRQD
jgi:glycosyltransferase involved in cell wall biosynthesis